MFKKIFTKKNTLDTIDLHETDVALRLMFEIAISDGSLDSSELDLIKKRANDIVDKDEKASSLIKK